MTLMHIAAMKGNVEVMQLLDQLDPKMLNKSGWLNVTPMVLAYVSMEGQRP